MSKKRRSSSIPKDDEDQRSRRVARRSEADNELKNLVNDAAIAGEMNRKWQDDHSGDLIKSKE